MASPEGLRAEEQTSLPHMSPTAIKREGSAHHLGKTVELALVVMKAGELTLGPEPKQ